jgi:glutamate racemase
MNCKLIVVACNTATTNAIRELRAKYDIPFIGIEPAIKPAATNSKNKKNWHSSHRGTLISELFNKTAQQFQNTKS